MDISIGDRKELYSSLLDQVTRSDSESDLDEIKRNICGVSDTTRVNLKRISDDLLVEKDNDILAKIIRLVAELGKEEQCRQALVDFNLFTSLVELFKNQGLNDLVKIQLCRAIGNMCYHNDDGRIKYLETCGLEPLFNVCKYATSLDLSSVVKGQTDDRITLLTVALGCLHNITNDNETLKKAAYEQNVMSVLKLFIPFINKSKGIGMYFASCIESLIELDEGKMSFVNEKIALDLYKNLNEEILDELDDYQDEFFDMLNEINELEKSKDYLCQTDFIRVLVNKMEARLDDEEFLRGSCLFIVNLLVRDDALTVFNYGLDFLINKAVEWLSKYKNIQLYVSSAVIIANYMRSDENSLRMINHELKPHELILNTLNELYKESPSLQEINVVHSFLGAMRNFCVNAKTREEILKYNTIETSLRFLSYENLEVKFKALAIIRLLIKNCNESNGLALVFEPDNLSKIGKIALNPQDHPGIAGESSRLVCYLPVAAKSEKNINKFCQANITSVICDQLKSPHLIMINEALLALNVLTVINYRAAHDQFKSGELSQRILDMYEKAKLPVEMMINSLKLFKILFDKNDFFTESELKSYLERFKKMKLDEANPDFIKSQLDELINSIENEIA